MIRKVNPELPWEENSRFFQKTFNLKYFGKRKERIKHNEFRYTKPTTNYKFHLDCCR